VSDADTRDVVSLAVAADEIIPIIDDVTPVYKQDLMHMESLNQDVGLAYGLAHSLVIYITDKYGGLDGFWKLARAYDTVQNLDKALQLLSLPREVGIHPETGTPIMAGLGRFGPFVQHDGTYANVESIEDVFTIGLNRAVTLIAEKKAGKGGRFGRARQKTVLKDLGEHPVEGGKIEVLDGKYGPYVSHNKVNATVPKGTDPATLSVDEAVRLLTERIAKGGGKVSKRAGKAKATKAKNGGDDAAAEKPAAKAKPAKKPPAKKAAKPKKSAAKAEAES
jgi:DNA topoisomerase-1